MTEPQTSRSERDRRIAEIGEELKPLHARIQELAGERSALLSANAREDWPTGPFTLHFDRHHAEETEAFDTPFEALRRANGISDYGEGFPTAITDRAGSAIYELGLTWKRVADGYPEIPEGY